MRIKSLHVNTSVVTSFKFILSIVLISLITIPTFSQSMSKEGLDTCKIYTSLEHALRHPDEVYILDLSKQQIKDFPTEIFKFKNLNVLRLNKNKLSEIPDSLFTLVYLQEIELDKNNFKTFPEAITKVYGLKKLVLSQNEIEEIPESIKNLKQLEHLDMWSNNLFSIPNSIAQLKNLKVFDLRVIQFSEEEKKRLEILLPNTKIHFSVSCNCGY